MTWWCAASSLTWTWTWRPYLGVWLFVVALIAVYGILLSRGRARAPEGSRVSAWQVTSYLTGVLILWIASDWPVGTLGSGYLLSVHTIQYAMYCLLAPPLLWLGIPRWLILTSEDSAPRVWWFLRFMANPLVGLLLFNAILLGSHTPAIIDGVRPSQLGSFAVDMAWLVGGLSLWWPVMAPVPEVGRLSYPLKAGYLFLSTVLPTVPSAFLVFAEFPLYALYELAPRVNDIPAMQDQLVAGIIMKVAGDIVMWTAMLIIFLKWAKAERKLERAERLAASS
jgi:putative membrane protein